MNIVDKTVPRYNEADIIIKNKDYAESMGMYLTTYGTGVYDGTVQKRGL